MPRPRRTAATLVALLVGLLAWGSLAAGAGSKPKTIRVSVKSNGKEAANSDNDYASASGDGRFVSFEAPGKFTRGPDDPGDSDVFVHDRKTGKTERVSVKANGKEVAGANSADSSISANGRFVAFSSSGALVPGDAGTYVDIYVYDRKTNRPALASVKSNGDQVMADSLAPAISANGRFVAFDTTGAFVGGDTNAIDDVYVHDMKTGKTRRVSVRSNGTEPTDASSQASVSGDGRFVAFQSYDDQMTADSDYDNIVDFDVFVRDMRNNTTVRASLKTNGTEADGSNNQNNRFPAISANGRYVAFSADPFGTFVAGDGNATSDVYLHDLKTGKTTRMSVKSNGGEDTQSSGVDAPASISANGRYVAFEAYARLVGNDTNDPYRDIYVHDRKTGATALVSRKSNGNQVDNSSHQLPSISGDGRFVAFSSMGKFTGGDSGSDFDVFERGPLR